MSEKLITAIIAGGVSIVVSLVGFLSAWLALRAKSNEIEREIRSTYMDRLYQMRLKHYPKAFEFTKTISRIPKLENTFLREDLLDIRNNLSDWINGPAGLIASRDLIDASYNLRELLGSNYGDNNKYTRPQLEKIVDAVFVFRKALRGDVRFLHTSDHSRI